MIKKEDLITHGLMYLTLGEDIFLPIQMSVSDTTMFDNNKQVYNNYIIEYCIRQIKKKNLILIANVGLTRIDNRNKEVPVVVPYTLGVSRVDDIQDSYNKLLELIEIGDIDDIIHVQAIVPNSHIIFKNINRISLEEFEQIIDDKQTNKISFGVLGINGIDYAILGAKQNGIPIRLEDVDEEDLNTSNDVIFIYQNKQINFEHFLDISQSFDDYRSEEIKESNYFKLLHPSNLEIYIAPKNMIEQKDVPFYKQLQNEFNSY